MFMTLQIEKQIVMVVALAAELPVLTIWSAQLHSLTFNWFFLRFAPTKSISYFIRAFRLLIDRLHPYSLHAHRCQLQTIEEWVIDRTNEKQKIAALRAANWPMRHRTNTVNRLCDTEAPKVFGTKCYFQLSEFAFFRCELCGIIISMCNWSILLGPYGVRHCECHIDLFTQSNK